MRIEGLWINKWRNFEGVAIEIPRDAKVVCLTGANGSGKTAIIELVSALAHYLGLTGGIFVPRGNPLDEDHNIEIAARYELDEIDQAGISTDDWGGEIRLSSAKINDRWQPHPTPLLGVRPEAADSVSNKLRSYLAERQTVPRHLRIDADRSFSNVGISEHEVGQVLTRDWNDESVNWNASAIHTSALYDEWQRYVVGTELRASNSQTAGVRNARQKGEPDPVFEDPFDSYRGQLKALLPHLTFDGVSAGPGAVGVRFRSGDYGLAFNQLSGGEREIAFLVGQVLRFSLVHGLLLIDEPELHLNSDLLGSWMTFLQGSLTGGQVWLATHSLEAVESVDQESTFLLRRQHGSNRVRIDPLAGMPVQASLAAALGTPAFSMRNRRFVLVEGQMGKERWRYDLLVGDDPSFRFLEGGGCAELTRSYEHLRSISSNADDQLVLGAVIDRDFRSEEEVLAHQESGIHVLRCHEIENLYLQPEVVDKLAADQGPPGLKALDIIRNASDKFAWMWIAERSLSIAGVREGRGRELKKVMEPVDPAELLEGDRSPAKLCGEAFGVDVPRGLEEAITESVDEYRAARVGADFWEKCLGKQAIGPVYKELGFSNERTYVRRVTTLWQQGEVSVSEPMTLLCNYLASLN